MRKLFKERKLFKGGNYMGKYDNWIDDDWIVCFLGSSEVCSFEPRKSPNSIKAAIGQINVT